jgi:hypothetical protein
LYSTPARFLLSLGSVFVSLVLGAIALALFWYYFPDTTLQLFKWAGSVRERLLSGAWAARPAPPGGTSARSSAWASCWQLAPPWAF